jgi:serine/threonine-protein kinase
MSPEQMRSTRATDGRTDIWSLGVILYELLSGRLPFVAQTMTELCAQILQDTPRPLPESVSAIDAIVQRCMAKDPNDRFASLAELAVALAPFGTASAQASAQRIVGVMNARLGGPGSTGPRSSVPSVTGGAASAVSQRAPSMGTDPTAVHAALPSLGATTPEMSAKGSPVVAVAVGATILVAGMIATAAFVTMGGKSNGAAPAPASVAAANTTSAAALPVAIPAVATSASVSGTPSSSVAPATPAPTSAVSAAAPKLSSAPAPPTHKHAPPRSSEEGMFDGRK